MLQSTDPKRLGNKTGTQRETFETPWEGKWKSLNGLLYLESYHLEIEIFVCFFSHQCHRLCVLQPHCPPSVSS